MDDLCNGGVVVVLPPVHVEGIKFTFNQLQWDVNDPSCY